MARFKNSDEQVALDDLGFTFFHFLKPDELLKLKELYQKEYHDMPVNGLHSSHNKNTPEKNKQINSRIREIVSPALERHFEDYRFYISHFVIKKSGEESIFRPHQDWGVVDEKKYSNVLLWIPLELTGPENGGLYFLPYVHRFVSSVRSGSFGIPFLELTEDLKPHIIPVRTMPEDAIAYRNSTFHGSYPNPSSADRVSIIVSIVSRDAPTVYNHKNTDTHTHQIYSLSDEEILTHLPLLEKGIIPGSLRLLEEKPLPVADVNKITSQYISEIYQKHVVQNKNKFLERPRTRRIIRSDKLEDEINEEGYAVIPFLNSGEINFLLQEFRKYFPHYSHLPSRFTSLESIDSTSRGEIYHIIESVVKPHTDLLFRNYKMPGAIFYMKQRQKENDISLHFDPTLLLNEHLEPHLGIWCPLVDTNEENGTIQVIPRSHRWGAFISNPLTVHSPLDKYRLQLQDKLISIPLLAGEALLWDDRIAHSSSINSSHRDRFTMTMRFTHQKARFASFLGTADKRVNVYSQKDNWYLSPDWDNEKTPPKTGTLQGVIERYQPEISIEHINRFYEQPAHG